MNPVVFAILAAVVFGLWTVFHKLASPYVGQVFGAILVSLTAVVLGGIIFFSKFKQEQLYSNPKGIIYLVLAGISAFFIDFLALKAYSGGLSVAIGGPIIIGGSIAIAVIIGFIMGDSISISKIAGILFLILGAAILAAYS
jgi:uncharacterized membrane protein